MLTEGYLKQACRWVVCICVHMCVKGRANGHLKQLCICGVHVHIHIHVHMHVRAEVNGCLSQSLTTLRWGMKYFIEPGLHKFSYNDWPRSSGTICLHLPSAWVYMHSAGPGFCVGAGI